MKRVIPSIHSIAIDGQGKRIAVGIYGAVVFIELPSGKANVGNGYETLVQALTFSPDGKSVAGIADGAVIFWDPLIAKEMRRMQNRPDLQCSLGHLAFAPDGKTLAVAMYHGVKQPSMVRLWSVIEKRELALFQCHSDIVSQIAWAPDGKTFATCSHDGTVKIWDRARVLND